MMRLARVKNVFYFFLVLAVCTAIVTTEAKRSGSSSTAQCDLPCTNGGICQRRYLTESALKYQSTRLEQDITTEQQELQPQRHYCQCPTGFVGSMCEIKLILCPAGINGTCRNGNACKRSVDDNKEEYYHCECDILRSDLSLPYAEKFCTHESTVFCINDIDAKNIKKNRQSLGGASRSSFCVNGGTCKDVVTENGNHVSTCTCPLNYSGSHCEVSKNPSPHPSKKEKVSTTTGSSTRHGRNMFTTILVFFVCFFTITVVSLTLLILYGNRNRVPRKPKKTARERAKIPKQSDHTTMTYDEVNTNEYV